MNEIRLLTKEQRSSIRMKQIKPSKGLNFDTDGRSASALCQSVSGRYH